MKKITGLKGLWAIFLTFFLVILANCFVTHKDIHVASASEIATFEKVDAGETQSMLIDSNGGLWGCGDNYYGDLGDGSTTPRGVLTKLMDNVKDVSAGNYFTVAIKNDNSLWGWGSNNCGQLGYQPIEWVDTNRLNPIKIMDDMKSVSAGCDFVCAIKNDGSLWTWGANQGGQLGDGTTSRRYTPVKVLDNVKAVSAGDFFTLALKNDGSVWAWGGNRYGELGDGTTTIRCVPEKILDNVQSISAGGGFAYAIKTDGTLWGWGTNYRGKLGIRTSVQLYTTPIMILRDVKEVSAGSYHTMAIKTDNSLWAWGIDIKGQLGIINQSSDIPNKVMDNVKNVSAGNFTLAIKENGEVWSWGPNESGQLGIGTTTCKIFPEKTKIDNVKFIASNNGDANLSFIKNDGSLWHWKMDETINVNPFLSEPIKIIDNVSYVSDGYSNRLAIKDDGSLWAWGSNQYGGLGDGTNVDKDYPVHVMDNVILAKAVDISNYAIKSDKTLWTWGDINLKLPHKSMDDVIDIEFLNNCNYVIKTDHSLWVWGNNDIGQFGNGTKITSYTPTKVMDNVQSITTGYDHVMVIKTDGTLWAWGSNSSGQIGDGTTNEILVPKQILSNVIDISVGEGYNLALKSDGTLFAWGKNNKGQLGDGTTRNKLSPVVIMNNVKSVTACRYYSVAVKNDGTVWDWGEDRPLDDVQSYSSMLPIRMLTTYTSISGTTSTITMRSGEVQQFRLSQIPDGYIDSDICWKVVSSSGDDIVYSPSVGVLEARNKGPATIQAIDPKGKVLAGFSVNVIPILVKYDGNGNTSGDVPINAIEYASKNTATVLGNTGLLNKTGYTFIGWNTKPDGSGIKYSAGSTFQIGKDDITLYAMWSTNRYTVNFNLNNGIGLGSAIGDYNSLIVMPLLPVRTGYTFVGWYKEADCINAWNFGTDTLKENTTLFAKWNIIKNTVSSNSNGGSTGANIIASYPNSVAPTQNPSSVTNNPAKPSTIKVSKASSTSAKVSWSSVKGVSGYEVYRATSKTGKYKKMTSTTAKSYTNKSLKKGTTYYYKIRAYKTVKNKKVYSGYTKVVSIKK
jgi:Listeria/Bacterioides repeat